VAWSPARELNADANRARAEASRARWYRFQKRYEGYFFLAPNMLGFLAFTAFAVAASLVLSFFRWDLLSPPVYVGAQQFRELLFSDPQFRRVVVNTFFFTFGTVPLRVILSLLLALALNERLHGITAFRMVYFLPVVTSLVAAALVFQWVFNGNFGLLNSFLWSVTSFLGIPFQPPDWLNSTRWAMPAVMILNLWKNIGFTMVIYLAGLQAIPPEFYEAAQVDGAGAWARFRHITVPLVSPTTFFVLLMSLIWAFQVFEESYIMTKGGPAFATTTVVYYIYLNAFKWFNMGKAAAIAWLLFGVIFAFTVFQVRYQRRWVHYEADRE